MSELDQEKSNKQITLDKLNKENAELDKLADELAEIERKIQQEKLDQAIMSDEVEGLLNEMQEDKEKKEQEEAQKIIDEREAKKKKIEEEERQLQEEFSNEIGGTVSENAKFFGYIKRYVLIGMVLGLPGIAITYLYDKWDENRMVKDLYQAHMDMIQNPNNVELERIYQKKKLEFSRAYNMEKIEKIIKESDLIPKIRTDRDELLKLKNEVQKANEILNKKIEEAVEKEAQLQEESEMEQMICEEEIEEELERIPPTYY